MKITIILAMVILVGCSTKPKHNAPNEISEPLLYPKNHATIGTSIGSVWANQTARYDSSGNPKNETYLQSPYLKPTFSYEINIAKWASYQIWPLYWKFLLTGDQFSDSLHLQVHKLHASIEGGVSGIYYSQETELTTSLALIGRVKYLFNERIFNLTSVQYNMYNTKTPSYSINSLYSKFGTQLSEKNSVSFSVNWAYYKIPKYSTANQNGVHYTNGSSSTEFMLSHSFYLFTKHILGPELAIGMSDLNLSEDDYVKVGVHYLYNFN